MGCCWGSRKQKKEKSDSDIEMGGLLSSDDEETGDLTDIVIHPQKVKKPPQTAMVSLQLSSDSSVDSSDTELPPVFYVIIGCGPAAVVNHTTLNQTEFGRKRLEESPAGKIPVLHIGFPNPWSKYFRHGMGQPPHLLSLPGFQPGNQPSGSDVTIDQGLSSEVFGGCIDREFERCRLYEADRWENAGVKKVLGLQAHGWPNLWGWVAWIDSRSAPATPPDALYNAEPAGKPKAVWDAIIEKLKEPYPKFPPRVAPYRLVVVDGRLDRCHLIYAQFIDACSGSGRANVAVLKGGESADYKMARTPPWIDPTRWAELLGARRILAGMDAIRSEVTWSAGDRVAVTQGGGIGLNAAEKAERGNCWLDWFHTADLLATFANPRNFSFLKHWSEDRARTSGEKQGATLTEGELISHGARVRMGRDVVLKLVNPGKGGVDVVLEGRPEGKDRRGKVVKAGEPHIRDTSGVPVGLASGGWLATEAYVRGGGPIPSTLYTQVALPNGLFGDRLGQPSVFAGHLSPTNVIAGPEGRMIAFETADHAIRLLGAAAQTYPGFDLGSYDKTVDKVSNSMWEFRELLPVSAVPDGFILSGINIAIANQFFTTPNKNVNTMAIVELEDELMRLGADDPVGLAKSIVDKRNKANGFKDAGDLAAKIGMDVDLLPKGLKFSY